jgi:hypothetical protein
VALLARSRTPERAECFARDEELLVGEARRLRFASFARVMAYWRWRADPDGAEDDAAAQRNARRLHLSQSFGDMWFLDGAFDPIGGTILTRELKRIEDELFHQDWAEAKARVGESVRPGDLCRTPAQRRADALVEMATPLGYRPGRGTQTRAALHRARRLRNLRRVRLRAGERHHGDTRQPPSVP